MYFIMQVLISTMLIAGIIQTSQSQGCFCTDNYQPFCGTDEKTYNNLCQLQCAQKSNPYLQKKFEGVCAVPYDASSDKGKLTGSSTLQTSGSTYGKTTYVRPPTQYIPPKQIYPSQNYKPYVPPRQVYTPTRPAYQSQYKQPPKTYIPPQQTYSQKQTYIPPQQTYSQKQTYIPPQQTYSQKQTYIPPQQTYSQKQTYVPPQQTYVPQQTYIPPQKPYVPPKQTSTSYQQSNTNSYKSQPSWAPSFGQNSY